MLQISPRELDKLIAETKNPRQVLEGMVKSILFPSNFSAPDPEPITEPDINECSLAQDTIHRDDFAVRVGQLQKLVADIEDNVPTTQIFEIDDLDAVLIDIMRDLLVQNKFQNVECLLRGDVISDEVLSDPATSRMAEFICLDQIGRGVITSLPAVAKRLAPHIFEDPAYKEAIHDGLRSLIHQGQLREATYFVLTYPQAKESLAAVLSEPGADDFILSSSPGPQTTGFTSFAEVRALLSSDEVQEKIEDRLKRLVKLDKLEEVVDYLREQVVTEKTRGEVRAYAADIVKLHLSEIEYYEQAEGRELEKMRDRITKQCDVVDRLIKSLELSFKSKDALPI